MRSGECKVVHRVWSWVCELSNAVAGADQRVHAAGQGSSVARLCVAAKLVPVHALSANHQSRFYIPETG